MGSNRHFAWQQSSGPNVRFSNRPVAVKRFQTVPIELRDKGVLDEEESFIDVTFGWPRAEAPRSVQPSVEKA